MSKLVEILAEMVAVLDDALQTDGFPIQIEGRRLINPTPPAIDIFPGDPFGDVLGAGFGDVAGAFTFTVRARVSTADQESGQDLLLALADDEDDLSVAGALMDDQTLNGTTASVHVLGPSGHTIYEDPGGKGALLGIDWRVVVLRAYS